MIQLILWVIVLSLISYESAGCDYFAKDCNTVCLQDGDSQGVVIDNKCGCWNPRDISFIPNRVPKRGKSVIPPAPRYE